MENLGLLHSRVASSIYSMRESVRVNLIWIASHTSSHVVLKKAGLAKIRITSQSAQTKHGELEWLLNIMNNISK